MKIKNLLLLPCLIIVLFLTGTASAQASRAERLEIFNKVWNTINEKYYDPKFNGVDWNQMRRFYSPRIEAVNDEAEFYGLIKQMVSELSDIHTGFRTPQEIKAQKQNQMISVGLWIGEAEGKAVVFGVEANSEAANAGIEPGMILTHVDSREVNEILAQKRSKIKSSSVNAVNRKAYASLLSGAENTTVRLSLLDHKEQLKEATLTRRVFNSLSLTETQFVSNRLPSGVGYIRFDEFNFAMGKKYKKALAELKDTKGLIIDLRFNRGGIHYVMEEIAEPLFAEKVSFGTTKTRTGKIPKFLGISLIPKETIVGDDGEQRYSAPIVVLTSNYSASAAEHFASGMQESGRAKILGTQSCGCVLGVMGKTKVKGGGELYLSQLDFVTAQGKRLETNGVTPDIIIAPTISEVRSGFSQTIHEAENLLNPPQK